MVMVSDIAERKRIDRMKSEFVSTVSHELRTPLTSINGALRLVAEGVAGELPPRALQMVVIAEKNSQRLTHLIDDLLDMEKLVEGKVRFDWQVVRAHADRRPVCRSRTRLSPTDYNVDLVVTQRADRRARRRRRDAPSAGADQPALQRRQVLRVPAVTSRSACHAGRRLAPAGRGASITGVGIDPKFHPRIFQKFSQADSSDTRNQGGTGLGLAISRELIERMDGSIDFTSAVGQGSTFYFELPVAEALGQHERVSRMMELSSVLFVEDDVDIQEVARLSLEIVGGLDVRVAGSGAEALELVRSSIPDLVLLDVMMPGMDGPTTLAALRLEPGMASVPVIFVTAKVQASELEQYTALGAIGVIAKPFDPLTLASTARAMWEAARS